MVTPQPYELAQVDMNAATELTARIADIDRWTEGVITLVKTARTVWVGPDADRFGNNWHPAGLVTGVNVFRDGVVVSQVVGAQPKARLRLQLEAALVTGS